MTVPTLAEIVSYGMTYFVVGFVVGYKIRLFMRFSENI